MKGWYERLSEREKVLVIAVLPMILAYALYQFAWVPLDAHRDSQRSQIADYQRVVEASTLFETEIVAAAPQNDTPVSPERRMPQACRFDGSRPKGRACGYCWTMYPLQR